VKLPPQFPPGTLLALRDPHDHKWNTSHQFARPWGIVVKVYPGAYHVLFSNGVYEYELHDYVLNVYKVIE
jgi:hypothetical protein